MKKTNLSGIFAAALIAVTIFTLASCSQDDEYYYDSEMFTRSEEMMTRGGEQGGYTPTPPTQTPVPRDTLERAYVFHFVPDVPGYNDRLPGFDVSIDVRLFKYQYEDDEGNIEEELVAEMIGHGMPYNFVYKPGGSFGVLDASFFVNGVYLELDSPLDNRFKLCASGSINGLSGRDYSYKGEVPNIIFY